MENTKILTESQMKAIEDLSKVATNVINGIIELIRAAARVVAEIWRQVIASYSNKRVVALALNHKDHKVRKKNRNRIIKWLRRLMRCKE